MKITQKHVNQIAYDKLDLLINDLIMVEIKAVEEILPVFEAQLLSYLKLASNPKGLLINFNCKNIVDNMGNPTVC